jgi:16S rRNA G966 N2-methylase RsmD
MNEIDIVKGDEITEVPDVRAAIEKATNVLQLVKINNMSKAAAVFFAAQGMEENAQLARESSLRAQRKAGEFLKEMPKNTGAQGLIQEHLTGGFILQPPVDETPTLSDLDIDKNESHRWQLLAEIPEDVFEDYIDGKLAKNYELTAGGLLNIAKTLRVQNKRSELVAQAESGELPLDVTVTHGDFREILAALPDNSIDMIFTDPPYDAESIPLYGDMARLAAQKLKSGGSLITYVGHYAIGEIYNLMVQHLRYWWIIADKHNGNAARLIGKNVFVEWKPLLWFVKERRGNSEYVADLFESSQPSKVEHDWQQDTSEAEYYIERLTNPGDLVVDPFLGSGTTLLAAKRLSRRALGIEINEENVKIARHRLQTTN